MTTFGRLAEAIGSEIRVSTDEGIYEGRLQSANKVLKRLTLSRVKCFDESEGEISLPGVISFQKEEIRSFDFISFPKPKTQPQKKTVQQGKASLVAQPRQHQLPAKIVSPELQLPVQPPIPKASSPVSQSRPHQPPPEIVSPKPQLLRQPPVPKASAEQNGHTVNQKPASKTQVLPNDVHLNGFADECATQKNSLLKDVSAAKHGHRRDIKLIPEVQHSQPNNVAKTSLTNGNSAEQKCPTSAWDRRIYFSDARSCNTAQNDRIPNQYVVIEHIDDDFYEMLDLIFSQGVIGCGFDGVNLGRNGKLCWMQVSANELVIIFDLLAMGCKEAFQAGLKDVLVSEDVMKVMHDCRQASDLLFHQFGIPLVNIFDTQVADVMIVRNKCFGRMPKYLHSLASCLKVYLDLTREQVVFYEIRKASIEMARNIWHNRPVTDLLVETMGLNVRYLKELRLATLDGMMADFTMGVNIFLHHIRDQGNEQAVKHMHGELLPSDFRQFSYASIIESDPVSKAPRTNSERPVSDSHDQSAMVNSVRPPSTNSLRSTSDGQNRIYENPGMQNGHASPLGHNSVDEFDDFHEMPELEDIEDICTLDEALNMPELDDVEHSRTLDEALDMPELEDIDVRFYDPLPVSTVKLVRPGGHKNSRVYCGKMPKKAFDSSDDETGSIDLRFEHFFRKVRQGFRQETPDISEDLAEPEPLSELSDSSLSGDKPSPVKPVEEKPFVEEPVLGKYLLQPKLKLENVPRWQEDTGLASTHMNILPAGMHQKLSKLNINKR